MPPSLRLEKITRHHSKNPQHNKNVDNFTKPLIWHLQCTSHQNVLLANVIIDSNKASTITTFK